jgi:ligand-binding sensor domain-containing protein
MSGLLAISDNNADSLFAADTSLSETWPASIAIGNGDTVFVGFYGKIFRSTDGGDTWGELGYEFPEENIDAMIVATDGTVFAAASDSGIYRSTDGGAFWEQIDNGLEPYPDIMDFLFLPNGDLLAAGFHGVYHTDNNGDTWEKLGQIPTYGLKSLARDSKGNLYISSRGGGVAVSEDEGMSWQATNTGLSQKDAQGLYIDDMDNIYVATRGAGVFKTQFVSSIEGLSSDVMPESFVLEQNYPNPFNPSTIINYDLRITNDVDLSIYNLLGQRIATLVSKRQQAGSYQIEWNASGFASGVYLYKLSIGNDARVRKMVLIK